MAQSYDHLHRYSIQERRECYNPATYYEATDHHRMRTGFGLDVNGRLQVY